MKKQSDILHMLGEGDLAGREILVVGLGLSGIASARFLKKQGANVRCTDASSGERIASIKADLEVLGIPVETGRHTEEFCRTVELVVTSPGVPPWAVPIAYADSHGIPVIGEIELAYAFCKNTIVAITGSNGKSTTTTLLHEILVQDGKGSRLSGNIGYPLIDQVQTANRDDILVTEISSFQLERIINFKPMISMLLNISQNHLDRYPSMVEYEKAKMNIFKNQDGKCFAIVNENLREKVQRNIAGKGISLISFGKGINNDAGVEHDSMLLKVRGRDELRIINSDIGFLRGVHNRENIIAAACAASILGVKRESITATLKKFKGLEHRLEHVAEINGVRYINDSKATTVDAVLTALDTMEKDVILIVGGRNKGSSFSPLCEPVRRKAKAVVLIGEARKILFETLESCAKIIFAEDMGDAVTKSFKISEPGDTVLLSPACSSYDMFRNFEERGKVFKDKVLTIKKGFEDSIKEKERTP